jgi:MFS transporter, UMF1 family
MRDSLTVTPRALSVFALSGSQVLSRSLFGNMAPRAQTAEFYGFYDISSKFAGLLEPFVIATVTIMAGSSRLSITSLIVFFIVGGLILNRVNEDEKCAWRGRQTP